MKDLKFSHVWFDLAGTLYKETPEFNEIHDNLRYQAYGRLKGISDLAVAKSEFLELYSQKGSNSAVFTSLGQPSNYWMKQLDEMEFDQVVKRDAEVVQALTKIKEVVPISLFTNFTSSSIPHLLELIGISADMFTHVISGDDVAARKPALDGFYSMIDVSAMAPNKIIYVCDRVGADVIPAKTVGIKTCLMYSNSPEADYCLDSFRKLPDLICS